MTLQFAIAFADKYLNSLVLKKEKPQMHFNNLYLKLLLAKKDFGKAEAYLELYKDSF